MEGYVPALPTQRPRPPLPSSRPRPRTSRPHENLPKGPPPNRRRKSDNTTTKYSPKGQRTMSDKYDFMLKKDGIDPKQLALLEKMARRRKLRSQQGEMEKGADVLESERQIRQRQEEQQKEEGADVLESARHLGRIKKVDEEIQELERERASVLERRGISHSKVSPGIFERFQRAQADTLRNKSTKLSMDKNLGGGKRRGKKGKTMKRKAKKSKRRRRRKSSRTRRR